MKRVYVGKKNIARGEANPYSNPVAWAIRKQVGWHQYVAVRDKIQIKNDLYPISPRVQKFLDDFNAGQPVQPFRFTLSERRKRSVLDSPEFAEYAGGTKFN